MRTLKTGIIGIGNMGSVHAKTIISGDIDGMELAAVADLDQARRQWAKENLPETVQIYEDAHQMMDQEGLEAVIVAVPHYDHAPLSIAALKRNLHVMCEKPVAVTTKQAREMQEAADASKAIFAVMFNQRTSPLYMKAKALIDSGELGPMKRTSWIVTDWYRSQSYYDSGNWRATWAGEGGGVLLNQCPHNLDLWQWICGMPVRVSAFCQEGRWHDIEVEDDVTAYVEYENGATGTFITSTGDAPGTNRLEIVCDGGKLVAEKGSLTLYRLEMPESEFSATYKGGFGEPKHTVEELDVSGENPQHSGVLRAFTKAVLEGTPLTADGREGIRGLSLSNAMHLSSWLGRMVELPVDEALFEQELAKKVSQSKKKSGTSETLSVEGTY